MANIITSIRIICAILIMFFPMFSKEFYIIYFLGGLSDAIDGTVARKLGQTSKLGSKLDTVADIIFTLCVIYKILMAVTIQNWILRWIIVIAIIKFTSILSGLIMHHRFIACHSIANKILGGLLYTIPLISGLIDENIKPYLYIFILLFATFAAVQEGHFIRTGKDIE